MSRQYDSADCTGNLRLGTDRELRDKIISETIATEDKADLVGRCCGPYLLDLDGEVVRVEYSAKKTGRTILSPSSIR